MSALAIFLGVVCLQGPTVAEAPLPRIALEGTALALDFRPVARPDGSVYWLSETEVPWEAFDVFVFGYDLPAERRVAEWDAVARPSRPYGSPDRGFGRRGFAALGMTADSAEAFCAWLGERTGNTLRLPSAEEWEFAARGGQTRPPDLEDDVAAPRRIPAELGSAVGFSNYEGPRPLALRALPAGALGLRGMTGNLAEWVRVAGGHTTAGGCFLDDAQLCTPQRREPQAPSWNETDPQNPKSRWWLANAPFVGFRVLSETEPAAPRKQAP